MSSIRQILFDGVLSGLAAGTVMGLISHAAFRLGIFKSSLFIIDGSFTLKSLGMKHSEIHSVMLGIPVHLLTSISFGLSYGLLAYLLHTYPTDIWILTFYVFLLWLSMLFVALPVAGQGVLGRRLGPTTWFEQLILHGVFGIVLWSTLYLLHQ